MVKKIIFILLIAVGIFLRVYAIEQIPGGLFGDEVALAVNTKTIAQNGTDEYGNKLPFGFESFSDYKMPGYIYASVIPFDIFGPRILSIRFAAVASSIISIFLIGYLAFLLFPKTKNIYWYAMILLALSPYHIHFSRVAYETMLATTLLLGFFIAFIQSIKGKRKEWFLAGVLLLFGACWTYPAPQFIIPVFLVTTVVSVAVFKPKDVSVKQTILVGLGFLLFAGASFIPELLNPATTKRTLGYVLTPGNKNQQIISVFSQKILFVFSSWVRSFNLEFLFDKGDVFAYRSGTKLAGAFLTIFLPTIFTGTFVFIKKYTRKEFSWLFLLILLVVCGLPSALTWSVPYAPRFLPIIIPVTILMALGLDYIVQYLNKQKWQRVGYVIVIALLLYQIMWFADIYFIRFPILSQPEFVSATKELGMYLKNERQQHPQDTIYFLEGRSCASWRYEYLHFWYYANLPNAPMIAWDKKFRDERVATGNPFAAYDFLTHPTARFDHVVLYPATQEMVKAAKGSILVHCGISLKDLNSTTEHIEKVFYLYPVSGKDPQYVVSRRL